MKYLKNFDSFTPINEDKASRAERKKDKADDLLVAAEEAAAEGDDKKAKRLIAKAAIRRDKAAKLDPTINTDEIVNKAEELMNKIENGEPITTDSTNDDLEVKSKNFRDKIKSKDFDIINKIKVIGDEISNGEIELFLKTVKNYLNEYWDEIKNRGDYPKEYISPYTDFTIQVKKRMIGGVVFLYKESGNDKIKIVFSKNDFTDENKTKIFTEIEEIEKFDNIKKEVVDNYVPSKDDKKVVIEQPIKSEPVVSPELVAKAGEFIEATTTKDDSFIKSSIDLLIEEKLNIGSSNTDEDKIFEHFVKKNPKKTVVGVNIDDILIGYRKKKATMNEAWYNDLADATSRATQSIVNTPSKGVVGDLMNAFNTDAKTLNNSIKLSLGKIANAYQKELDKEIDKALLKKESIGLIKEDFGLSMLLGALGSGYALKKIPALARLVGINGARAAAMGVTTTATSTAAVAGAGASVAGAGASVAGGSTWLGATLVSPWFWIPAAIIGVGAGSWYLWNSFDEQQDQLATIFIIMWASGSKEFSSEMKKNDIVINQPKLDISKLNDLIKSGEMYGEGDTEVKPTEEVSESRTIKSFKDFKSIK